MSIYAIGDVQGCYAELMSLLEKIQFKQNDDELWFAGDLVNRGPQSLEVLRFVRSLGNGQVTVLGNHDLHVIAVAYGVRQYQDQDTFEDILNAPDGEELISWLRHQRLMYYSPDNNAVLTHAGLHPFWSIEKAAQLAVEVEQAIQGEGFVDALAHLFGNSPDRWDESLTGEARIRCIVNYFTRMRFCYQDGRLDFHFKDKAGMQPEGLSPWFVVPGRMNADIRILFGHWAALEGKADEVNIFPLDTGCAWGGRLTALRLEDQQRFSVPAVS